MRYAVILAAIIIKSYLWYRIMTSTDRCVVVIALIIIVALTFAVRKREEVSRPREIICTDPAQRQIYYDYEMCQFKLRTASLQLSKR